MAGDEGNGGIRIAMRDRDAGIGEPADPRRDPRNDAEWYARRGKRQRFFSTPPEYARVATLQPQHPVAGLRQPHEPCRDVRLGRRGTAAALPGVVERRAF